MGEIHVHEFISLDGVVDDPSWTAQFGWDEKMGEAIWGVTGNSQGILLGRKTYDMFEPAWSVRTVEDDEGAPFFNDTTKYVVSSDTEKLTWRNSEAVGPYKAETIRNLKARVGNLYVSGSISLVQGLLADGLVDRLHLFVYPITLGNGTRLFPDGGGEFKMSLEASDSYGNGVVYASYRPEKAG